MMLDTLEARRLLAGVVTVITDYGPHHRLLIQGDDAANEVVLHAYFLNTFEEETPANVLQVFDGRLIVDGNEIAGGGRADPYVSSIGDGSVKLFNLSRPPLIDLGDGDDLVLLDGDRDNAFAETDIRAGDGNDRVTADGGFYALRIDSGSGDDRVTVIGRRTFSGFDFGYGVSGVVGDLEIATGQGKDRIALLGDDAYGSGDVLRVGGRLRVSDNSGPTQVSIANVRTKRATTIALSRSNDAITVFNTAFGGETRLLTGDGNDVVRFRGKVTVPNIRTALQLGRGGDVFDADRYYDDFVG